jgi:hypothetical protein
MREHDGYSYYTNKREAEQHQRAENDGMKDGDDVIEYYFKPTRKGVLALLHMVASHPDNG